jgi:hypothetical protein
LWLSVAVHQQDDPGSAGQDRYKVTRYGLLRDFDCPVVWCFGFGHDDPVADAGDASGFHDERVVVVGNYAGVGGAFGDGYA